VITGPGSLPPAIWRSIFGLGDDELRAGAERLRRLVERYRPRVVAVAGIAAYRIGFGRPAARIGQQADTIGGAALWVVPNPSGLNAHYSLGALGEEFGRLRSHVANVS
jgi:TDG/mug DNA glycosylase family protein